jgi:hypothetical protein
VAVKIDGGMVGSQREVEGNSVVMGKKECSGCFEPFSKKSQPAISCAKCSRDYCKECGQDLLENYNEKDGSIEECEHCSGKQEGEPYNSDEDSAGEDGEGGCEICQKSKDEDKMLLCDYCDLAFHIYCLDPPITVIPEGEWYCNDCKNELALKEKKALAKAASKRKKEEEAAKELPADKVPKTDEPAKVEDHTVTA